MILRDSTWFYRVLERLENVKKYHSWHTTYPSPWDGLTESEFCDVKVDLRQKHQKYLVSKSLFFHFPDFIFIHSSTYLKFDWFIGQRAISKTKKNCTPFWIRLVSLRWYVKYYILQKHHYHTPTYKLKPHLCMPSWYYHSRHRRYECLMMN